MPIIETIKIGLEPNDGEGDNHRSAFQKVNLNFSALNSAIQGVLDTKGQANGYASLGADGRLLAAQAPIVYAPVLPTTAHDLNTFVTPGTYYQAAVAGATAPAGVNYPVAQVGFLEVVATGTPVLQVYTTRNATPAIQQRFWRVRVTSSTWSAWKEVVDTTATLSYAGRLATAQDLNTYTTRGIWFASAASIATGGSNYPVGTAGFLLVLSESALGGAAQTSGVSQRYESVNGKVYTRYISGGVWSPWVTLIDSSVVGVASGVGSLDGNGRSPVAQFPMSLSLTAGTDANTVTAPGVYYTNSDAQATAVLNWPEQLAGTLNVEAAVSGNSQITQTYTTRNGTGGVSRTYKRVRFGGGAGVWGMWQQQARYDDAMTHVLLTTATDANTLTADNTFYTWRSGTVVVSGSNWAPVGTNVSGGHLEVRWAASDYVIQTVTIPISGAKPRIYQRFGSGTSWQAWKIISPVSSITWLPTADAGDVYVDGLGWHCWNGSAYELSSLAITLPTTAHDLNTYQTPGAYRQASTAGATAGSNYPVSIGGTLDVHGSGSSGQTVQTYTVASTGAVTGNSGPRMFWRFAINTTWSPWTEVLSAALGMTHQFLSAATDANTLTADNTFYSWTSGSLTTSGSNFPAGIGGAGYMRVVWQAATIVSQELTALQSGGKPRTFFRYGNTSTGVWQSWKSTGSISNTAGMPSEDCGDIYVDGEGTYRWNGSAYARWFPSVPQNLTFSTTGVIEGNWLGSPQGLRFRNNSASPANTYVNIVPGTGGSAAGILCADKDNTPNAAYGSFNISDVGVFIESGRFGSAAYKPIVFYAIGNQLGRINTAATWELGPTVSSPVLARVILAYDGASSRYGISFRPGADETRPCHFSNAAGNEVGFIATGGSSTFYSTTSDYRAKENIVDMDAAKALAVINLLKPRSFTMKADGSHQDGFIAHELQEHIPLAVAGEKDAVVPAEHGAGPRMLMQGVDLSKVVPYLVAAMQEQQRLIDMLRQQIEVLTPPPENG